MKACYPWLPGQQSMSPVPLCGKLSKNSEMALAKLKICFITRYSLLTLKGADCLKQIASQTKVFILKVTLLKLSGSK